MKDKLFDKPKTIFQQDLNDIMKSCEEIDLIEDLIGLQMFKQAEKCPDFLALKELYNYLGTEKFMGAMDILAEKKIKFPSKESFKETIQIALCWYYRKYKNLDWPEIKGLLKDESLSTVRYGIKVQNLQNFIEKYSEICAKHEKEEVEDGNGSK